MAAAFKDTSVQLTEATRNKNGKGYRKHFYTTKTVASLTGRAVGTIRNDIGKGVLDMSDMFSVAEYLLRYRKFDEI